MLQNPGNKNAGSSDVKHCWVLHSFALLNTFAHVKAPWDFFGWVSNLWPKLHNRFFIVFLEILSKWKPVSETCWIPMLICQCQLAQEFPCHFLQLLTLGQLFPAGAQASACASARLSAAASGATLAPWKSMVGCHKPKKIGDGWNMLEPYPVALPIYGHCGYGFLLALPYILPLHRFLPYMGSVLLRFVQFYKWHLRRHIFEPWLRTNYRHCCMLTTNRSNYLRSNWP